MKSSVLFAILWVATLSYAHKLPPGGLVWQNCTRPHEVYACGSACQTECKTLGKPCAIVNVRCNDACYCVDGYARDATGVCIPIEDCPPKCCC